MKLTWISAACLIIGLMWGAGNAYQLHSASGLKIDSGVESYRVAGVSYLDWRTLWIYLPLPAKLLVVVGLITLTCHLVDAADPGIKYHAWAVFRFALFILAAPLIVAGTVLATIAAPYYWLNPGKVPAVGMRWLRTWWAWVTGRMSTWDFIR